MFYLSNDDKRILIPSKKYLCSKIEAFLIVLVASLIMGCLIFELLASRISDFIGVFLAVQFFLLYYLLILDAFVWRVAGFEEIIMSDVAIIIQKMALFKTYRHTVPWNKVICIQKCRDEFAKDWRPRHRSGRCFSFFYDKDTICIVAQRKKLFSDYQVINIGASLTNEEADWIIEWLKKNMPKSNIG